MIAFQRLSLAASLAAALAGLTPAHAETPKAQCTASTGYAASFGGRQTFLWRPQGLSTALAAVQKNPALPAYTGLLRSANKALTEGPWSVTAKPHPAPSHDVHDYTSLAPYFWPDPQRPDAPYIRKDGQVNPQRSSEDFDRARLESMSSAVRNLGLAYYLTNDKKYADRAALVLRTWFLDPATRMNPNLNFAQGVPGRSTGRAPGVIDGVSFIGVVEAIGLLQPSGSLSETEMNGLRGWFGGLSAWMVSSPIGQGERAAKNNHGIYYDLQLSEFALFSGDTALAKTVIGEFPQKRITAQFALDGSLPEELARTRSFHYSMWTMLALYDVATLGECVGADLWSYQDTQGKGLRKGTDFILSYAGKETTWSWPELQQEPEELYTALLEASYGYDDPKLRASAAAYAARYPELQKTLITPLREAP